ncbi:hypothetical protein [Acetonema longum]|uniref:Secreted protein n=1 Tax=Acetonema longum DSM 6540 TaxID=1009370 RepID=F7NGH2_9FIRM|nr:hypothetical protein [Acetonema longum]EGO64776.1 hypothetical protein ALO_05800 [Acetonema longum DSM 6540]
MSRLLAAAAFILVNRMRTAVLLPKPVSAGAAIETGQDVSPEQPVNLNQTWERYGRPVRYTIESSSSQTGWHVLLPHQPDRL